ncbi:MAG: LON peptidase substrate-binding domain-containing protein, partial [Oscillospiraceae bacterium]|nr:LON peptidase substrate-binding domain-containing protein [Oscillospiraceae bacterium]
METKILTMPMLALRGLTIFPNVMLHFDVGRQISIKALDEAMERDQTVFLVAQREIVTEEPKLEDLYQVGTISKVRQILRLPGDTVRVMVEGESRGRLSRLLRSEPSFFCEVEELPAPEPMKNSVRVEAQIRRCYEIFERYTELAPKMVPEVLLNVLSSSEPGYIADYI